MSSVTEVLVLRGTLEGHNGWVTSLATSAAQPDLLLSGSRDQLLILWQLTRDETSYGVAKKLFHGHLHIVQDCTISADGLYALSALWDKTLRLWDLRTGECAQRFVGHTGDVTSVLITKLCRFIVSASRDKTIKLWNTVGVCYKTLDSHSDWVSTVRFSQGDNANTIISAGWDKLVKVCLLTPPRMMMSSYLLLQRGNPMRHSYTKISDHAPCVERLLTLSSLSTLPRALRSLTTSSLPTSLATPALCPPLPCLLTALCARLVARTV